MKASVLIVDDHARFRQSARLLLEAEGYDVVGEAEDGRSGLSEAERLTPEVVLLDVLLPDIDGFAVAAELTGRGLAVVVLTSSRDGRDFGPLVTESGARGFIPKTELSGESLAAVLAFTRREWSPPEAQTKAEPGADILVVGSGELAASAARAPLEEAGHTVRSAPHGLAALTELHHRLPDVVVTEWQLPRLDGDGLCQAVRADPELEGTHIIVMTGADGSHGAVAALEAGADDYLATPFERAELLARVRTGRRTAQLRASEARLRALMANVPGAIYRCAPDRDWTMELISDEIERISGYPPEDFIDSAVRTFASVIHPDDRESVERAVFEACEVGRPFVLEYRIQRADGGETWVLERGQLVHGINGRTWLDGCIFDISARREAEVERRRREAEQARVIELRASRTRIIEASDEARRRIERDLHDGAQQRFVAVALHMRMLVSQLEKSAPEAAPLVQSALDELQATIDELREVARGIHPAVLSERGLVRAVEALIARMPMAIELAEAPPERLPESVEAALYYVISESLTNACKHAVQSAVSVRIGLAEGRAWAEVQDDGVGGARPNEGSGLSGLKDRVETLDGTFEVKSPPGDGTTVRAEVPCA
jgi:PAS domain S-box-containing protein